MKRDKNTSGSRMSPTAPPPEAARTIPGAPGGISQTGRWVFRLIAGVLPLLTLCAMEVFLRMAGYGYPTAFFIQSMVDGRPGWIENQKFGWRFFPPAIARTPEPLVLPAQKPTGTCRIFIFGESAAQGDPEPSFAFWRYLHVMLQARYPGVRFEMVNTAMTAISSHVIREIARDCADKHGDVWIVLMGNNEVVGPFGAGTVFGPQAPNLAFIRGSIAFKATRLGQWMTSLRSNPTEPAIWEGMEMFVHQQIRRDDPRMSVVYDHFQKNLANIVQYGQQSGARVLVSTLPCNLKDCAPFGSLHRRDLNATQTQLWNQAFQQANALLKAGQSAEARVKYEAAQQLDGEYAELLFQQARSDLALGKIHDAQTNFVRARERDTLRFRSDTRINQLIRQTARELPGTELVDAVASFERAAPQGLPGEELFWEHVHFRPEGNYLLAKSMWEKVVAVLPDWVRQSASSGAEPPSFEECSRRLALTDWDRLNLTDQVLRRMKGEAPFTLQANQAERCQHLEAQIAQARVASERHLQEAREEYRAALKAAPDDWMLHANFATLLEGAGDTPGALDQWRAVLQLVPHHFNAWYRLSDLTEAVGQHREAGALLQTALRLKPNSPEVLNGLGLLRANEGHPDEAIEYFEKALHLRPNFAEAEVNLGQTLAGLGRTNEARRLYEGVLCLNTNNAAAHINLGKLLTAEGRSDEAAQHYAQAVRLKPDHPIAHFNFANALARLGRFPEALDHYQQAVRLRPAFPEARLALGLELARADRAAEAIPQFQETARLQPQSAEAHQNLGVALARQKRYAEAFKEFQTVLELQPGNPTAQKYLEQVRNLMKQ